MNHTPGWAVAALALAGPLPAQATEYGLVVTKTPAYAQVAVPQRQCGEQEVVTRAPQTGAGAVIGALIGGGVAQALGSGPGRGVATGAAAIAGAVVGDRIEANNAPTQTRSETVCQTVSVYETRLLGYDVVYEYQGQRYSARLVQDPGERVPLNVSVSPAVATVSSAPVVVAPVVTVPPPAPTVWVAPPVGVYGPWGWERRRWH